MKITLIAAMAKNRAIGKNNQLLWHLSADLKHFKALTLGKPIIMGRKTFESIGKPLPGRKNIILTQQVDYHVDGCSVVNSISEALISAGDVSEVMIIGGANIYELFLPQADYLYLTEVDVDAIGDTYFPVFDLSVWQEISREMHSADDKNPYNYSFVTWQRRVI